MAGRYRSEGAAPGPAPESQPQAAPTFRVEGDKIISDTPTIELIMQKDKTVREPIWLLDTRRIGKRH